MGKNKKKGGNKQASEVARVVPVGLTITYGSSKQGNKKANVTSPVPNVSPEVSAAVSADSTSNRQQKKRNRGTGAGDGTRVVQEEAVKLQDQGVLQNVDDMAEVSDTPQVFTDDPHWEDSNEDPPAVTPQKDSPPAVKNLNIEDVSNIPDLTTNSYQEDYSEETSLKDAHDLDSFEDPQAVTTKECDYVPSVETDSFQQQEMQQVPSNPYQMSSSSAMTTKKHNLNREASHQNPYHSSESSCAMNNRKQQHGKDSVGDWASDSPQDNGKNYNKGSGNNNNRSGGDRPSDSSPYHNRKNYNKDSGYNNRSAGEWPRNSSPYNNKKSFNQGRGNDNRSFESKSWSRQGSGYKSRDENFRGNRSREGGSNEKWRNDNPRNEDHERGNQRYREQRHFQNSNKDGEGKSNDRESYKRRNQKDFGDDNKDRRNRSREGNSNVWENESHEASGSNNDQPDVTWGGGEVVADASWEGKADGSWDIHIENQESSGHKDSRENRSDERDGQFWRDGSNRDSRTNRNREGKSNWSLSGNENYHSQGNRELDEFWKFYKSHKKDSFKKVKEIEEDLFKMPPEYALAHCVAEDMSMGSGIAVQFSQQFKSRDELYQQRQKQGGLAVLTIKGRFIYYLVTKRISNGKPTLHTMWCSLRKLQQHMEENKVGKLAIPRIGCGLDRLEWSEVKAMIEYVFLNTDVEITVCNFQQVEAQSSASAHKGPRKCAVRNVAKPLVQIEDSTMVIYFGTEDGFVSEVIESLDTKFKIVNEYKTANRRVGEVVLNYKNNYGYALYGFIINKHKEDPFDFVNLQKCLGHLKKTNRQDKYGYVAFEAFLDEDDLMVSKICSVLRYSLYDVEVYVCWPGKLASFMPRERRDDYY